MTFDSFQLRILVDKPVDEVFWAWANVEAVSRWFVKAEYAPAPVNEGSRYRWTWAEGTVEEGEFTQVEPAHILAFTFSDHASVVVRFGEVDGRCKVQLEQHHTHDREEERQSFYVSCLQGWTFYLTNLKSVLESGNDLRELSLPELPLLANV